MKKILLLCMVTMFALSGLANAEIIKEKDDSGLLVGSTIKETHTASLVKAVSLNKHIVADEIFYRLTISIETKFPEWLLKNSAPAISIDKYPKFYCSDYHYSNNGYNSSIEANISLDIANKIAKAKHVYLMAESGLGSYIGVDKVLPEWKEVINTTE